MPRTTQDGECLVTVDVSDRFLKLCRAHPPLAASAGRVSRPFAHTAHNSTLTLPCLVSPTIRLPQPAGWELSLSMHVLLLLRILPPVHDFTDC